MSRNYTNHKSGRTRTSAIPTPVRAVASYVAAVVFFLVACLSVDASLKTVAILCVVAAVAGALLCVSRLRERFTLPLGVLALFVLMCGVSTFYAVSGKFALTEFLKVLIAFCMMLMLLALTPGEGEPAARRIACVLERCAALMGVVSIDLISTRWISTPVLGLLNGLGGSYDSLSGVETGVRMTSMFDTPNVFAGCVGIGVLLSLSLALSSETKGERRAHVVCLYINALSFVLAFSMGASAFIAVAFLVYLLLEYKEKRAQLFLLMAETLVLTVIAAALVSMTSFTKWTGFRPVPLLCMIVGAALLCLLDQFVGQRAADTLKKHGKALLAIVIAVLLLLAAYAVAAFNMTGGVTLGEGERLRRAIYPQSGEYTLSARVDGAVTVRVESQNRQDTMMHTSTELYKGDLAEAKFTVPEDSMVVYFNFSTKEGATLEQVECVGAGTRESIPLGYKLLPDFIANRLQGLFANQNAIQRLVFFEDGMKLFRRSPVVGLGMGSYENGNMGVQSFFYETKYAHNHYIQTLVETGVIGLILFVGTILVSAAAIVLDRRKKEGGHPMTPVLAAILVFMAGHAATEVTFSYYAFLPLAFGVFGLISLCCGGALPTPWLNRKAKLYTIWGICLLMVVYFGFLCANVAAYNTVRKAPTLDNFVKAAKMDRFEWTDYALSYVLGLEDAPADPETQEQGEEFARRLALVDSNSIPSHLARHYFKQGDVEQGFAMVEKYVSYVSSDPETWESTFKMLERYAQDTPEYRAGVSRVAQLLEDWNRANIGKITLSESATAFINEMVG